MAAPKEAVIGSVSFGGTDPIGFRRRNPDKIIRVHGCGSIATLVGAIADKRIAFWEREARTQNAGVAMPKRNSFCLRRRAGLFPFGKLDGALFLPKSIPIGHLMKGWNFIEAVIAIGDQLTDQRGTTAMPRAKKIEGNLEAISARRAALEAELAQVAVAEKKALEAERDAGRDALIGALGKVKIARMDRSVATAIAKAIEKHGGAKVAEKLAGI